MLPWKSIATAEAPDGTALELRRRGDEYLIAADGHDLMSSDDGDSARALADLGCAHIAAGDPARVLVGGLGMGYTLRAALACVGPAAVVEVAELVAAVAEWNRVELAGLAGHPLRDPRSRLQVGDVRAPIRAARAHYDAILLDVDNGPDALAHAANETLYSAAGLTAAREALRPGGVLAVWSFSDDPRFTRRLERAGFVVRVHRVSGSRRGRGRHHRVWVARRTEPDDVRSGRRNRS